MGVEAATYIGDLTPTTPGSSDLISQGDDHIRLIKQVLQNSFPSLESAISFPRTATKSANYSIVAADKLTTFFVVTTAGSVQLTLPTTLGSGDAGWECYMMKASFDVNPVMIVPGTGTLTSGQISGLSAARRCIPTTRVTILWTGSSFIVSRATSAGPVGSAIEYHGSSLPFGYEWPNGQLLASASTLYPELNAVLGSGQTLDKRGRFAAVLDNLGGSAASRITTAGGGVDGATEAAVGGSQAPTLITANLPAYTPSGGLGGSVQVSSTSPNFQFTTGVQGAASGGGFNAPVNNGATVVSTGLLNGGGSTGFFTGNAQGGSSTPLKTLPPTIMVAQLLVTE